MADHFRWAVKVASNAARRGDRDDRRRCYDAAVDALMFTAARYDPARNDSYRGYLTAYVVLGIRGARSWAARQRHSLPLDAVPSDPPIPPDHRAEDRDEAEAVLAPLDERERSILTLAYLEGQEVSGAARTLGISLHNAWFWRNRAIARIRAWNSPVLP